MAIFGIVTKTDWQFGEYFDRYNYNRIKNNYIYLWRLALTFFSFFPMIDIKDVTYRDLCFEEFFNNVEENINKIADAIVRPEGFEPTKRWVENGAVWDHDDINRIERMSILFYELLTTSSPRVLTTGTFGSGINYQRQVIRTVN